MANKTHQIVFRVTQNMYERLQDNADARGISVSDYLREIVKPSMYRHSPKERFLKGQAAHISVHS